MANRKFKNKCGNDLEQSIGSFITKRRKELKIKQYDFSNTLDVSRATLWNYERGYSEIPVSKLIKICELLKFDIKIEINEHGINMLVEREEDRLAFNNESGEIDEKSSNDIN